MLKVVRLKDTDPARWNTKVVSMLEIDFDTFRLADMLRGVKKVHI